MVKITYVYLSLQHMCEIMVWDYEKTNTENIKKAISNFDLIKAFENPSVDEKVDFLNKTLLNIFINYFSKKMWSATCMDDRQNKKVFKRNILADKIRLQKWSEKNWSW